MLFYKLLCERVSTSGACQWCMSLTSWTRENDTWPTPSVPADGRLAVLTFRKQEVFRPRVSSVQHSNFALLLTSSQLLVFLPLCVWRSPSSPFLRSQYYGNCSLSSGFFFFSLAARAQHRPGGEMIACLNDQAACGGARLHTYGVNNTIILQLFAEEFYIQLCPTTKNTGHHSTHFRAAPHCLPPEIQSHFIYRRQQTRNGVSGGCAAGFVQWERGQIPVVRRLTCVNHPPLKKTTTKHCHSPHFSGNVSLVVFSIRGTFCSEAFIYSQCYCWTFPGFVTQN